MFLDVNICGKLPVSGPALPQASFCSGKEYRSWQQLAAAGVASRSYRDFLKWAGVLPWSDVPVAQVKDMCFTPPHALARELAAAVSQGQFILDYGCGAGRHLRYFRDSGLRPIGVDPHPTGPAVVRQALPGIPAFRIDLNKPLPFESNYFAGVLSTYAIYHGLKATVDYSIQECIRVLKPGGFLNMILISTKDFKFGLGPQFERATFGEIRPGEKGEVHHFFDLPELLQSMNGLSKVTVQHCERPLDQDSNPPDRDFPNKVMAHWLVKGVK